MVLADLPPPEHDPDEVRELADEILSRPAYREPPESLFERIDEFVGELMERLLDAVGLGGTSVPSWVAWLVLGVLVAIVALLVGWVVRAGGWGRRARPGDAGDPVITSAEQQRSPREWLAQAERDEAEGRWRQGLLCRYRALVTALVEDDVIPATPGRTAGEYVRDVREGQGGDSAVTAAFTAATDLFETAWYGGVETGPAERDEFARLSGRVLDGSRV